MSYNGGDVLDIYKIPKEDVGQALKEFAEGSGSLEKLLNLCYNRWLKTAACCIGHFEESSKAYLMLEIFTNNLYDIQKLVNLFDVIPDFCINFHTYSNSKRLCGLYCPPEYCELMFDSVCCLLENDELQNNVENQEIYAIYDLMMKVNENGINAYFTADINTHKNSEYFVGFGANEICLHDKNAPFPVDEFLNKFKKGYLFEQPVIGKCKIADIIYMSNYLSKTADKQGNRRI